MLKNTLKSLMLATLLTGTAGVAFAQDIVLRATATSNTDDEDYDGLVVFKNYVENASNGTIGVELFIGTQLCTTGDECLAGVADGSIDIFVSTSGGAAGIFPYIQVLDLPYLMSDDRIAEEVLTGDFVRFIRDKALEDSDNTIRLMTVGNTGGWRNYANTERRVTTPADLQGLKLRTVPADLPQELARGLGASPTPIAWPELFTSLQTGVVEGTANGITDIMNMKFPDAGLKYLTLDGHSYMGAFWFMNNERFMGMTDEQKTVIVDGFAALQQATFASPKRKEIQAYADFREAGGDIYVPTPDEKEAFREAAAPVFDWFRSNVAYGTETLEAFTVAVEAAQAKIDAERAADMN
ncbi:TRAP transporter substrate-binding protein [Roseicitreum antarcticum]|uniref:TRAP-type C4-dicarboxylate transport system, substrate-binding protein n=1 Tax=Roseicitreum antarcticum TaxID=564137 RepID=A0A1H2Z7E7_9RHOB|nr:TRAP transporter substrate-binding protein DctP [Roseicitreum antarcticum]SDX13382.1 TRAP-type C4-dicarboxylate transport system, substrate-binding protein [Roseicitreum antarcticum]